MQRCYSYNALLLFCSVQLIFVFSKGERETDGTVTIEHGKQLDELQLAVVHITQLIFIPKWTLCFGKDILEDAILAPEQTQTFISKIWTLNDKVLSSNYTLI